MKAIILGVFFSITAQSFQIQKAQKNEGTDCWQKNCANSLNGNQITEDKNLDIMKNCSKSCQRNPVCMKSCLAQQMNDQIEKLWKCGVANKCFNTSEPNDICTTLHCSVPDANCAYVPPCVQLYQNCYSVCQKQKKCMVTCAQNSGNSFLIAAVNCIVEHNCRF